MSQESIEIVRQALDAYARRDIAALREINDADLELDWTASHGWQARVYRGIEDALVFMEEYFEAFDEIVFETDDLIDAGESVVVPNTARQRGRDGVEVTARSALVFTVRDGKITRIRLYQDTWQALEAVGLAE
jgi:ketosteroid isomerase-like protein